MSPEVPVPDGMARDGEQIVVPHSGQTWTMSWHPPLTPPEGKGHGADAVCVTEGREVVIISEREGHWNLPGGRPEPGEAWEDTMRREVLEEACATVRAARLLGFARGQCLEGHERGLVLVRSFWRADIDLLPWTEEFEICERRTITPDLVLATVTLPDGTKHPRSEAIVARALHEAAVDGPMLAG